MEEQNREPTTIRFTVYGSPVPKQRARTVTTIGKNGKKRTHSFTPEETKVQEQKIALVYKSVYHGFKFEPDAPLVFVADFYIQIPKSTTNKRREAMLGGEIRPTVRNMDVDNDLKLAMDALLKTAYEDDSQIVEATGRKFYSEQPRTEIFIARLGDDNLQNVQT